MGNVGSHDPAPRPQTDTAEAKRQVIDFLDGFSISIGPSAVTKMTSIRAHLRPGTKVHVGFLGSVTYLDVAATAKRLREEGLTPVPCLPARRIPSRRVLQDYLSRVRGEAGVDELLIIAGDVSEPVGEYRCSMQLLETGLLDRHGIRRIAVAGHPEGNRDIGDAGLRQALDQKNAFARRTGAEMHVLTQFCFEAAPIIAWDKTIRAQGNGLPIHVGIPGPATLGTLIHFARRCGIGPSMRTLTRRAGALANLAALRAPDRLVSDLARYKASDPECGIRRAHIFPFGDLKRSARWLNAIVEDQFALRPGGRGFTVDDEPDPIG